MTEVFAGVNGQRVTSARVVVSNRGPWFAECDFEGAPDLSGKVMLTIDTLRLQGTIVPEESGTFGLQRRVRIVAGAGGWAKSLEPRDYHNDAGVKARAVADDAARAVGETIGTFVPAQERIGIDYAREAGPASRTLENAIGGAPWWVDYDGVTHVGPRSARATDAEAYHVLAYEPRERVVTLGVDDLLAVQIGSVLTENLDAPQTVREFVLTVQANELRVMAWCGGTETSYGVLAGLLRSIIQRTTDARLWGKYRYRVIRMNGARVELQAVRKIVGLPDLLPISMWPGVAGVHAELDPGAEVLIEFLEGDRGQPVLTHFGGKEAPGFVPVAIALGGEDGAPAGRQGDAVEVLLPPAVLQGTIGPPVGPAPITGVMTFTTNKALGTLTAGSGKVKIA
jgi:hypothetical protein